MMFSSMVLSSAATVSSWHTNNFPQSSTSTPEIVSKYLSMPAKFSTGADLLACPDADSAGAKMAPAITPAPRSARAPAKTPALVKRAVAEPAVMESPPPVNSVIGPKTKVPVVVLKMALAEAAAQAKTIAETNPFMMIFDVFGIIDKTIRCNHLR